MPDQPQISAGDVLRLSDVRFAWGGRRAFALSVPEFGLTAGEKLLLMGPSGSGKTTLLSLVCGIARPQHGAVEVLGTDIARLPGAGRDRFRADHFGIVFQMFNLLPYGSVMDNVLLPLHFSTARRKRATAGGPAAVEARRLLEHLQIGEELYDRAASALSVGQQQRVAVARALIGRPEIVIADEPTSALDRDRREAFLDLLLREVALAGASLVMVSHDDAPASRFDRVLPIDEVLERAEVAP